MLCVGLDTDYARLPECLKKGNPARAVLEFNKRIIDATAPFCVAFKPNLAFYECLGKDGLEAAGIRYIGQVREMLSTLETLSKERSKLMCLSETGLEGLVDPHWWTGCLYPAVKDFPVCYVLTWRNAHDKPGHFYAPWKGFSGEDDFKAFSEKEDIVMI